MCCEFSVENWRCDCSEDGDPWGPQFGLGDTVGCGIDCYLGTIW